ncbi:MAG: hypothetical protein H0U67_10935, partial [Gemmatimonadetes bacterium]|nr:hypothetical protein [Gemmatimonadota bacterium]
MKARLLLPLAIFLGMGACAQPGMYGSAPAPSAAAESPQDMFWSNLQALCGQAVAGQVLRVPEGDTQIDPSAGLVVHFWECSETELRFPLHVDENRSRTWVFIRHHGSLELRHDHRHPDGTEESNTWYGASTLDDGTAT